MCPCSKGRGKQRWDLALSLMVTKVDSLKTQNHKADFVRKCRASRERLLFLIALNQVEPAPEKIRAVKGTRVSTWQCLWGHLRASHGGEFSLSSFPFPLGMERIS